MRTKVNEVQRLESLIAQLYGDLTDAQAELQQVKQELEKCRRSDKILRQGLHTAADRAGLGEYHPVNVVEMLTEQRDEARGKLATFELVKRIGHGSLESN
jgi:chromosome segregation ATPase